MQYKENQLFMNATLKYSLSTLLALIAFAGNSVLCRLALADQTIDATSFTILRLVSGAITLWCLVLFTHKSTKHAHSAHRGSSHYWRSGALLFIYAAGFSYAYIALDTGIGALILFGCVQLSMISVSLFKKERFNLLQYAGLIVAFSGLVYLVLSQNSESSGSNSLMGVILMGLAGVAWAGYTLMGKGSASPLLDTKNNFIYALPFCLALLFAFLIIPANISTNGVLLALASGAITSGLGYAIWYIALEGLSRIQAGVVQLLVPVIAAIGGAIWANEALGFELILAQIIILGGIAMVLFTPKKS